MIVTILLLLSVMVLLAISTEATFVDDIFQNNILAFHLHNGSQDNSTNQILGDPVGGGGDQFSQTEGCLAKELGCYFAKETDSYINLNNQFTGSAVDVTVPKAGKNYSIAFAVNLTDKSDFNQLFKAGADGGARMNFLWRANESNRFLIVYDDGSLIEFSDTLHYSPNRWYHTVININYTASKAYLVINGTPHSEVAFGSTTSTQAAAGRFGGENCCSGSRDFLGVAQGFYIQNRTLTSDEIISLNRTTVLQNDSAAPTIKMSLNDTSLELNNDVNVTGNFTDGFGLSFCQIINNQTGENVFTNISLSGVSDFCSEAITIGIAEGVINFTIKVNDTSNLFSQESIFTTLGDSTPPIISNISLQHSFMNDTDTNIFTIKCEDAYSLLDRINFTMRFNETTLNLTRFFDVPTGEAGGEGGGFGISGNESLGGGGGGTKTYIMNYTLFESQETAREGRYNITNVGCTDQPLNYFGNDSSSNLAGFDFLMDTAPAINSRTPADNGVLASTDNTTFKIVATETNPDSMLLYHNVTGNFVVNQTINYSGDGTTQNLFNLTGLVNGENYTWAIRINTTFGTWTNSSNFTFSVDVSSGGGAAAGGGGGGGGTAPPIIINETVITGQCNFNNVCEPQFGEDSFNCGVRIEGDCEFEVGAILPTCLLDKTQQCVFRTAIVGRILLLASIISFLVLLSDTTQGRKVRKVLKERLNINILKE